MIKSILAKFTSQGKIVILIVDQINSADNDEFRILMELIRSFFPWTLIIFIESANNYIDQNVEKSLRLFTRHLCDFFISTIKWEEMKTEINKKIDINSFLILINDGVSCDTGKTIPKFQKESQEDILFIFTDTLNKKLFYHPKFF